MRLRSLMLGSTRLETPAYFPSISSIKTQLPTLDYLSIVTALNGLTNKFLVSAFDLQPLLENSEANKLIDSARKAGGIVLMDSGNYESFWRHHQENWKQDNFHSVLDSFSCDIAFSFDEQNPPNNEDEHVDLIVNRWKLDQQRAGACQVVPIVHGTSSTLPELCRKVAEKSGVEFIAVAERRLGDGLIARALTIRAIRESLNSLGRYIFLHVLGTGNPISLAVFSLEGADSFDGLEWCQTIVDHESALLFHLSQADFFIGQTSWADSDLPFHIKSLAHNLEFYRDWMNRLQRANTRELHLDFCKFNFPSRMYRICADALEWEKS